MRLTRTAVENIRANYATELNGGTIRALCDDWLEMAGVLVDITLDRVLAPPSQTQGGK